MAARFAGPGLPSYLDAVTDMRRRLRARPRPEALSLCTNMYVDLPIFRYEYPNPYLNLSVYIPISIHTCFCIFRSLYLCIATPPNTSIFRCRSAHASVYAHAHACRLIHIKVNHTVPMSIYTR